MDITNSYDEELVGFGDPTIIDEDLGEELLDPQEVVEEWDGNLKKLF